MIHCKAQIEKRSVCNAQCATRNRHRRSGFTLVELVVAMAIVAVVAVLFMRLSRDITDSTLRFSGSLVTQQSIQATLEVMIPEIRSIAQSNDGAFPISAAATSSFEFYSDIDRDGLFDRVRYFLSDTTFKKGVIEPTGSPLTYATSNEVVRDLVYNVVPAVQIFSYYDSTATSSQSTALPLPIDPLLIKTVRISLFANQGTASKPSIVGVNNEATIRNLRYK